MYSECFFDNIIVVLKVDLYFGGKNTLLDIFRYMTGSLYLTKAHVERYWREVQSEPASRFIFGICVVSCPMIPVQSNAFTVATGSATRDWTRLLLSEKGLLAPEKRRQMLESTG